MRRGFAIPALLAAALLAMPALAASKVKAVALPPWSGAYQPAGIDERGLWMELDEAERDLRDAKQVIPDPALHDYVHRIVCDTVGRDRCAAARIYIVRDATPNASMAPNGLMRINTGLLLRFRSEAELAAVLGHEFGHFEQRHSLASFKAHRSASDIQTWLAIGAGYGGTDPRAAIANTWGSFYAYKRDQERTADQEGFRYLAASQYRPGAFADFWSGMMEEADATALARHQRSSRYDRVSFFATHPTDLERATTLRALAIKDGDDGEDAADRYVKALATWRPQFLADQIKLNDFGGTEYLLGRLAASGWTPDLLFARGELYRLRGNPRDLVAAAGFYREAIAAGGSDPLAHRGLGLALLRSGQAGEGRAALADYLRLKPDCEDAAMLRSLAEPQ